MRSVFWLLVVERWWNHLGKGRRRCHDYELAERRGWCIFLLWNGGRWWRWWWACGPFTVHLPFEISAIANETDASKHCRIVLSW